MNLFYNWAKLAFPDNAKYMTLEEALTICENELPTKVYEYILNFKEVVGTVNSTNELLDLLYGMRVINFPQYKKFINKAIQIIEKSKLN